MDIDPDDLPIDTCETYKSVGIFSVQSPARIERAKRAIDHALVTTDVRALSAIVRETSWPPEARLFALAKIKSAWQAAAEQRRSRPRIDIAELEAKVAVYQSRGWARVLWRRPPPDDQDD